MIAQETIFYQCLYEIFVKDDCLYRAIYAIISCMQHEIWIPALHRDITNGIDRIKVEGTSVNEVLNALDAQFPGLRARLCDENGIRPSIAVAIDGVVTRKGLRQKLEAPSEIHFVPAMSGG